MAVHDRHVDIEKNQLWLETGNYFDCGESAIYGACFDAHHLQERYKAVRNLLVIIDDQNSTGGVVAFFFVIETLSFIHWTRPNIGVDLRPNFHPAAIGDPAFDTPERAAVATSVRLMEEWGASARGGRAIAEHAELQRQAERKKWRGYFDAESD